MAIQKLYAFVRGLIFGIPLSWGIAEPIMGNDRACVRFGVLPLARPSHWTNLLERDGDISVGEADDGDIAMSLAALGKAWLDLDREAAMEMAGRDDLPRNLVDTMPPPLLNVTRRHREEATLR
mmetsp:Transcript_3197/g.5823  ORF Transcript_3197/g.5823 Transcript_3197/m.5823 type:complete len:123 (-) Transcript_3197:263-631(-)